MDLNGGQNKEIKIIDDQIDICGEAASVSRK